MYYDGVIEKPDLSEETLVHYGVKGMKWGIRRYEKKGGTKLTKRIAKWREAEKKYSNDERAYKSATDKKMRSELRAKKKQSRKELSRQYKQVKYAHRADQGADLYSKGKTITSNVQKLEVAGTLIAAGSYLLPKLLSSNKLPVGAQIFLAKPVKTPLGQMNMANFVTAGFAVGTAVGTAIDTIYKENQNRKLRAFYSYRGA